MYRAEIHQLIKVQFLSALPRNQRVGADGVIDQLRSKLNHLIGLKVYIQNVPTITIGGQSTKSQYQYTLQGLDQDELFGFPQNYRQNLQLRLDF